MPHLLYGPVLKNVARLLFGIDGLYTDETE